MSFPWPDLGPIRYDTTTNDATAVFTCVQHMRDRSMRRTWFVSRRLACADQVHSFMCSCPKEVVDDITSIGHATPPLTDVLSSLDEY